MLVRVAAVAALGGFLFGYDLGLIGGAMLGISQAFNITNNSTKETIVGAAKFGAFFGTFIGGVLMLRYGRRFALAFEALFFVTGPIVMAAANGPGALVVGRLLVGLGIGASAIVVPTYLAEIAPAAKRGAVVQTYEVMLTLGMLCAGVINWALISTVGPSSWRWMVGLPAAPGALLLLSPLLLPESPRWLVLRGRLDPALAILHNIIKSTNIRSSDTAQAQQALALAEDELLLLWSSVQKEQAAGLELRQEHRAAAAAAATVIADGTVGLEVKQDGMQLVLAPLDVFTLDGDEQGSSGIAAKLTNAPPAAATAAADDNGGGDGSDCSADLESRRTTYLSDGRDAAGGDSQLPASYHAYQQQQQQQQQNGSRSPARRDMQRAAADDSQVEQLLSHHHHSSNSSFLPSGVSSWVQGWLRGSRQQQQGTPQQQQQQLYKPGQEANVFASLWAMLYDVVAVARGPERAAFAIAAVLAVFDQATASTAVINYAPEVLSSLLIVTEAGSAILYPAVISVTKVVGVAIALLVVDSWGRKPLLAWGGVGCGAALLLAGIGLAASSVGFFLFCLCVFIFSFSVSWAGLYWVIVSEIFSMGAKSPATSAATSLLFLTGAVVNLIFLTLVSWLRAGAFAVFAGIAFGSAVYVYRSVPETKGKTLVEIQALLAAPANGGGSSGLGSHTRVVWPGRWRGWDWGRTARPSTSSARAAFIPAAAEAAALNGHGNGAAIYGIGDQIPAAAVDGFVSNENALHSQVDYTSEQQGGQYWQQWLQRQQQQQGLASSSLALPLGLELTAAGNGVSREQSRQQGPLINTDGNV